jgi:hypothetical protein
MNQILRAQEAALPTVPLELAGGATMTNENLDEILRTPATTTRNARIWSDFSRRSLHEQRGRPL